MNHLTIHAEPYGIAIAIPYDNDQEYKVSVVTGPGKSFSMPTGNINSGLNYPYSIQGDSFKLTGSSSGTTEVAPYTTTTFIYNQGKWAVQQAGILMPDGKVDI